MGVTLNAVIKIAITQTTDENLRLSKRVKCGKAGVFEKIITLREQYLGHFLMWMKSSEGLHRGQMLSKVELSHLQIKRIFPHCI